MTTTQVKIPKKGTDVELKIDSLAFGGMGVSRIGDMIVFVKNAIPGQTVFARITKKRSSFLEARKLNLIEESPQSVPVKCDHFNDCGGCTFQNLDYKIQTQYKEQHVHDNFKRIGGFTEFDAEPILVCDDIFHYRNKMEFTFSNRRWTTDDEPENVDASFALGLHISGRYNKILDINYCHLQSEDANRILNLVKKMCVDLEIPPYDIKEHEGFMRHLMIRHGSATDEIMVNLVTSKDGREILAPIVNQLVEKFPNIVCIVNNVTTRRAGVSSGEHQHVLFGKDTINEKLGSYEYMISADSFFQTNTHQAKRLYDVIVEEASLTGNEVVYDLFCGTGSISLYLAQYAKQVYGFELVMSAVQDAMQNAQTNNIKNAMFFAGDLMNLFRTNIEAQQLEPPHVMIVDPPRAGLHPKTVEDLLDKNPEKIVYVSCNPSTQARDVKILCENGFELKKIRPVDMFPHTPHIENIATLVRS